MYSRQFAFDIHRILNFALTLVDNDAKSCYDRLIPHLTSILFQSTGTPRATAQTFLTQLLHRESHVLTGHGISNDSIVSSPLDPLFGVGQGNGAGPAAWHAHLLMMIETLQNLHPGNSIADPTSTTKYHQHMTSFVDDTSFIMMAPPTQIPTLLQQTEHLLNIWNDLLQFTGGELALDDKTKWCLSVPKQLKHKTILTDNIEDNYFIKLHNQSPDPIPICRIPPSQAERYLGVRIATNGQMQTEYEFRLNQAKEYSEAIRNSSLNRQETLISYRAVWLPRITYSLPITSFSQEQCHRIQSPVLITTLPKLGLNRHLPRAIVYGPTRYGGLTLPHLYIEQGRQHVKWLTSFVRTNRNISNLFHIFNQHGSQQQ